VIRSIVAFTALLAAASAATPAGARSLAAVKDSGTLGLCAHPNSLPFASKDGKRRGFQVELAEALAHRLGVALSEDWVISRYDLFRANCDVVMDAIADPEAQEDSGLRLSRPYRRSGVALAVRADDRTISGIEDLKGGKGVGVLSSSIAEMTLDKRGITVTPGLFEDELLAMLGTHEVDAAAVTPTSAGYYNLTHRKGRVRLIYAFDGEPDLSWNVAVGMRRPDDQLQQAIDEAIARMLADGTIKRIYARYGTALQPPR
jgi:polar amino acid transport system substrate-binding protein